MLQPRTKSAPEPTSPLGAKLDGEKTRGGRPLGDRVRSLSLADLPESRISVSSSLGWLLVIGLVGGGGWYWWSSRSIAAKALAASASVEQKSPRPSGSTSESPPKSGESSLPPTVAEKAPLRPATFTSAANAQAAKRDVVLESKG